MDYASLSSVAALEPEALLEATARLAATERGATVALVVHLAEIERRDLHLQRGFASMFDYCTGSLRLSESAAYARILAARTARRYPQLLDLLRDGAVNLTTVTRLAAHLTPENHDAVLREAVGLRKMQLDELVARLRPRPDAPTLVRRVAAPRVPPAVTTVAGPGPVPATPLLVPPASSSAGAVAPAAALPRPSAPAGLEPVTAPVAPPRPALVEPLAPERYRLQLTIGRSALDKLRQARELLGRTAQAGDDGALLERALDALLADLAGRRRGRDGGADRVPRAPKPGSRHVPMAVRRAVHARDEMRCAYVGPGGQRCPARSRLEFHHVRPWMAGGEATVANIELRCAAHNAYEARVYFARPTESEEPPAAAVRPATPSGRSWPAAR